jgi:hypothetical protein
MIELLLISFVSFLLFSCEEEVSQDGIIKTGDYTASFFESDIYEYTGDSVKQINSTEHLNVFVSDEFEKDDFFFSLRGSDSAYYKTKTNLFPKEAYGYILQKGFSTSTSQFLGEAEYTDQFGKTYLREIYRGIQWDYEKHKYYLEFIEVLHSEFFIEIDSSITEYNGYFNNGYYYDYDKISRKERDTSWFKFNRIYLERIND